jgi:hypothetical protein
MAVKFTKPEINVREKLAELDKPSGIAGEAMLRADTVAEQQALIGVGRRNMIINGDFQVSQRGDYSSASNLVESTYFVDRWRARNSNSMTATKTHSTRKVALNQTSAGTGSIRIDQKIEIIDNEQYTDKYMTLSADIKSNDSNARIAVYHQGWDPKNTQHSGGGGWERLTLTFWTGTLVTGNEFSIQLGIDGDSSANVSIAAGAYVEIKNVQLEFGKVATPFEHRSYGEELALCQRYYQQSKDGTPTQNSFGGYQIHVASGQDPQVVVSLSPNMRATPSVVLYAAYGSGTTGQWYGAAFNSVSSFSANARAFGGSPRAFIIDNTDVGASDSGWAEIGWTASAEL